MTRENKLALIVGFSIILVVGVLVSDHFSKARQAQLTAVEDDPRSVAGDLVDPLSREEDRPRVENYQRPVASGRGLLGDALQAADTEQPSIALSDPDPLRGTGDPIDAGAPAPVVFHQGTQAEETGAVAFNDDPLAELMTKAREQGVPLALESSPSTFRPRGESRPQATRTAQPPALGEYVVQPNDSLYAIAKKFMGTGERWKELRDLNKDRLPNGEVLRVGMRLRVPANTSTAGTSAASRPTSQSATARQGDGATREYEVKPGDVLSVIAQRELGSSKRMGEVLELNKDKIDDADEILVGMKLRLPSR